MLRKALPVLLTGLTLAACETTPSAPPPDYYRPPTAAEQTCVNQGFVRGSDGYDQCMARLNSAGKPAPPPVVEPKAGVFAFKDEFGFRYDALGNRIDAEGHIISARTP
jgi:hypothetical protein